MVAGYKNEWTSEAKKGCRLCAWCRWKQLIHVCVCFVCVSVGVRRCVCGCLGCGLLLPQLLLPNAPGRARLEWSWFSVRFDFMQMIFQVESRRGEAGGKGWRMPHGWWQLATQLSSKSIRACQSDTHRVRETATERARGRLKLARRGAVFAICVRRLSKKHCQRQLQQQQQLWQQQQEKQQQQHGNRSRTRGQWKWSIEETMTSSM